MHDWVLETWYGATGRGRWLAPLAWLFGAAPNAVAAPLKILLAVES